MAAARITSLNRSAERLLGVARVDGQRASEVGFGEIVLHDVGGALEDDLAALFDDAREVAGAALIGH